MIFVDSCVLINVFDSDAVWKNWSLNQLQHALPQGLCINMVVYSEIAGSFANKADLDAAVKLGCLDVKDIPTEAAYLASTAFARYRRNKGQYRTVLPDFYIGAHAQTLSCPVLTRDTQRFAVYFPDLQLGRVRKVNGAIS